MARRTHARADNHGDGNFAGRVTGTRVHAELGFEYEQGGGRTNYITDARDGFEGLSIYRTGGLTRARYIRVYVHKCIARGVNVFQIVRCRPRNEYIYIHTHSRSAGRRIKRVFYRPKITREKDQNGLPD